MPAQNPGQERSANAKSEAQARAISGKAMGMKASQQPFASPPKSSMPTPNPMGQTEASLKAK